MSALLAAAAVFAASLLLIACGGADRAAVHFPAPPHGATTTVPRLIHLGPDRAIRRVQRAGLQLHPAFPGSSGNPAIESGCSQVYNQAPPPGARRPRGSQVSVTIGVCHGSIAGGMRRSHRQGHGQSAGRF